MSYDLSHLLLYVISFRHNRFESIWILSCFLRVQTHRYMCVCVVCPPHVASITYAIWYNRWCWCMCVYVALFYYACIYVDRWQHRPTKSTEPRYCGCAENFGWSVFIEHSAQVPSCIINTLRTITDDRQR